MTNEEKVALLALNMKRCIEIMAQEDFKAESGNGNAELKAKMHEVRRDSIHLEKVMYPDWRHIHR